MDEDNKQSATERLNSIEINNKALETLDKLTAFLDNNKELFKLSSKLEGKDIEKIKAIAAKTPENWSPTTNAPYYTEKNGLKVLEIFNKLLEDTDNDMYFDTHSRRINVKTFCMQFHQGWQWLRERHPDVKIRELAIKLKEEDLIQLRKNGYKGVRINFINPSINELLSCATKVGSVNKIRSWKDDLDKFIDEATDGQKLEVKKLVLSNTDKIYIETVISQVPDFGLLKMTDTMFVVAKIGKVLDKSMDSIDKALEDL